MNTPTEIQDEPPLPINIERVNAYAWQCAAAETILFHGAATLTTSIGMLPLECGTWLLVRWHGLRLNDTLDGELVCLLPERS